MSTFADVQPRPRVVTSLENRSGFTRQIQARYRLSPYFEGRILVRCWIELRLKLSHIKKGSDKSKIWLNINGIELSSD